MLHFAFPQHWWKRSHLSEISSSNLAATRIELRSPPSTWPRLGGASLCHRPSFSRPASAKWCGIERARASELRAASPGRVSRLSLASCPRRCRCGAIQSRPTEPGKASIAFIFSIAAKVTRRSDRPAHNVGALTRGRGHLPYDQPRDRAISELPAYTKPVGHAAVRSTRTGDGG